MAGGLRGMSDYLYYDVLQWMVCGLSGAHTPPVHVHHVRLLVYMMCYSGWFVV